eukprot:scaffold13307_cov97-Isochrysis_galbana.AAC.2
MSSSGRKTAADTRWIVTTTSSTPSLSGANIADASPCSCCRLARETGCGDPASSVWHSSAMSKSFTPEGAAACLPGSRGAGSRASASGDGGDSASACRATRREMGGTVKGEGREQGLEQQGGVDEAEGCRCRHAPRAGWRELQGAERPQAGHLETGHVERGSGNPAAGMHDAIADELAGRQERLRHLRRHMHQRRDEHTHQLQHCHSKRTVPLDARRRAAVADAAVSPRIQRGLRQRLHQERPARSIWFRSGSRDESDRHEQAGEAGGARPRHQSDWSVLFSSIFGLFRMWPARQNAKIYP